ncbi:hypothetical protein SAMN04489812_2128 [Microlunatus soli]|uniref:Uncharacterized protein n=1 Tax=Microlunatus soli TaxID=630515 RepID=A0A1H1SSY3_9ACTN|nr:hypothetical protein SAMN04489812_2128 [Microlunatus soli]
MITVSATLRLALEAAGQWSSGQAYPAREQLVVHALGADCTSTPGTIVARGLLGPVK